MFCLLVAELNPHEKGSVSEQLERQAGSNHRKSREFLILLYVEVFYRVVGFLIDPDAVSQRLSQR
jgi:hypothetical protein